MAAISAIEHQLQIIFITPEQKFGMCPARHSILGFISLHYFSGIQADVSTKFPLFEVINQSNNGAMGKDPELSDIKEVVKP